jgi:hypothetical protein
LDSFSTASFATHCFGFLGCLRVGLVLLCDFSSILPL